MSHKALVPLPGERPHLQPGPFFFSLVANKQVQKTSFFFSRRLKCLFLFFSFSAEGRQQGDKRVLSHFTRLTQKPSPLTHRERWPGERMTSVVLMFSERWVKSRGNKGKRYFPVARRETAIPSLWLHYKQRQQQRLIPTMCILERRCCCYWCCCCHWGPEKKKKVCLSKQMAAG